MSAIRTIGTAADELPAQPTHGARPHDTEPDEVERLRSELHQRPGAPGAARSASCHPQQRILGSPPHALPDPVFTGPPGNLAGRAGTRGMRGLRRLKKTCAQITAAPRQARRLLDRRAGLVRIDPGSHAGKDGAWSILCLPVIEWSFRFQRPQQLMRQFARNGHRVLYAANHFHAGSEPRLRPIELGIDELILPGDPAANVYQTLPAPRDVERMLEAVSSLVETSGRLPVVIMVQLPYWSDLAEQLRRRFGWPIVYDCMDDHAGFLHNTPAVLEAEQRLIAASDLVIASSEQLARKVELGAKRTLLVRNACEYHHFAIPDRRGRFRAAGHRILRCDRRVV